MIEEPLAYRPSIVAFIDVLGFKQIVGNGDKLGTKSAGEIAELLRGIQSQYGASPSSEQKSRFNLHMHAEFSDSIVQAMHYGSRIDGVLRVFVRKLLEMQLDFATKGVFVRGAMTVGNYYQNGSVTFGPALTKAVELEIAFANYPRIIIDPAVFVAFREEQNLQNLHEPLSKQVDDLRFLLRRGEDGLWFINYLKAFDGDAAWRTQYLKKMSAHKSHLEREAKASDGNLRVLQKYMWLARYHNEALKELRDSEEGVDAQIDETTFPGLAIL